jgi:RNA recognition motif-containing protein
VCAVVYFFSLRRLLQPCTKNYFSFRILLLDYCELNAPDCLLTIIFSMFKIYQVIKSFNRPVAQFSTKIVNDGNLLVIVTNLPTRLTVQALKDHMVQIGPVVQCDIIEKPERVGHVQFQSAKYAIQSVEKFNDSLLMGKKIRLEVLQQLQSTTTKTTIDATVETSKLFLHNLAFDVTNQSLQLLLLKLGIKARSVEVITTRQGKSKGLGVVELISSKDTLNTMQLLQGAILHGRPVGVREDRSELLNAEWKHQQEEQEKLMGGFIPPGYEANSVFVGNLAMDVSSVMLKGHMSQVGPVMKASILRGRKNMHQGSGIVVYENRNDAARAVAEMHDTELWGRLIYVREDKEAKARSSDGSGVSAGTVWRPKAPRAKEKERSRPKREGHGFDLQRSVYVGNLSWRVNSAILGEFMSKAGVVARVKVFEKDGKPLGNAIVEFEEKDGADRAIATLKGTLLCDRKLFVRENSKN